MTTITRHTIYNLVGRGTPLALFIVTIPLYISALGAERYGVLAIAWLALGMAGMIDLGMGKAAMQRVAALRDGSENDRRAAVGTAILTNAMMNIVTIPLISAAVWFFFAHTMQLPPLLRVEALLIIPVLAAGIPAVTAIGVLEGALAGRERFFEVNRISVVNSSLFQLLPLAVAWMIGPELWLLLLAAVAARYFAALLLWLEVRKEFGGRLLRASRSKDFRSMATFGGWVTVTSLAGLALVFSDRFLIGSVLGAVAVTVYSVPLDATRRMAVLADAISSAIFPRLALADEQRSLELTRLANCAIYLVATPPVAALIVLAEPLMTFWLGDALGSQSAPILQILAIAGWVNLFAKAPVAQLQAQNRPRTVAMILFMQFPFYFTGLFILTELYGLLGAAIVYCCRNVVDTIVFACAANRPMPLVALTTVMLLVLLTLLLDSGILGDLHAFVLLVVASLAFVATLGIGWFYAGSSIRTNILLMIFPSADEVCK